MTTPGQRPAATGPSLLAVFAHPDDEALACGGLLAWWSALGLRTSLLCLTRGELGAQGAPGADGDRRAARLAAIRARELQDAAAILGIGHVTLLGHADGMLPWTDPDLLASDIARVIDRVAADVVVTFDADGLYWHPDHIAVHERTTAAVAARTSAPPALYYVTMPPGAMRAVADHARDAAARSHAAPPRAVLGVSDPDALGACAPPPSLVLDTGAFAGRKLRAIKCHRSQLREDALALVTTDSAPRLLGAEHYRRAEVGARGETLLDRLGADPDTPLRPPMND